MEMFIKKYGTRPFVYNFFRYFFDTLIDVVTSARLGELQFGGQRYINQRRFSLSYSSFEVAYTAQRVTVVKPELDRYLGCLNEFLCMFISIRFLLFLAFILLHLSKLYLFLSYLSV